MQPLVAIVEHLLASSPGDPVVEITRTQVLASYLAIHKDISRDDALVYFEECEPLLAQPRMIRRWHVRYRPGTSSFHCEKVPDAAYLERMCEVGNSTIRSELRHRLETMDGFRFEKVVAEILASAPWVARITATQPRKDGGIDLELDTKDGGLGTLRALGQAKRWTSKVPVGPIREFIGALQTSDPRPHLGFFVATAGYTEGAREAAEKSPLKIRLFDLDDVVQWQLDGRVGVKVTELSVTSIDEQFWSEVE